MSVPVRVTYALAKVVSEMLGSYGLSRLHEDRLLEAFDITKAVRRQQRVKLLSQAVCDLGNRKEGSGHAGT